MSLAQATSCPLLPAEVSKPLEKREKEGLVYFLSFFFLPLELKIQLEEKGAMGVVERPKLGGAKDCPRVSQTAVSDSEPDSEL